MRLGSVHPQRRSSRSEPRALQHSAQRGTPRRPHHCGPRGRKPLQRAGRLRHLLGVQQRSRTLAGVRATQGHGSPPYRVVRLRPLERPATVPRAHQSAPQARFVPSGSDPAAPWLLLDVQPRAQRVQGRPQGPPHRCESVAPAKGSTQVAPQSQQRDDSTPRLLRRAQHHERDRQSLPRAR